MMRIKLERWMVAALVIAALVGALGPTIPAQAQDACPGFMLSRLEVDGLGRAQPVFGAELRLSPGGNPQQEHIPGGGIFTVLDGPTCAESTAWWFVDYNGVTGWAAEGEGITYWLEPLPALPASYDAPDGSITIQHPDSLVLLADDQGLVVLGSETVTDLTNVQSGQLVTIIHKSTTLVPSLANATGSAYELMTVDAIAGAEQGYEYGELVELNFPDRNAAFARMPNNEQFGGDLLVMVVELGNGEAAYFTGITAAGQLSKLEPVIMAMAYSLHAPGAQESGAALPNTLTMPGRPFSFRYPDGWIVEPLEGMVIAVNTEAVYAIETLDDLLPGQFLLIAYPTLADMNDYPMGMDATTVPSTVVSYYASMGFVSGYQQAAPMEMFTTADGREASSWMGQSAGHDRLVMAVTDGQGDIATFMAYAPPGELAAYEPVLRLVLNTVNAP